MAFLFNKRGTSMTFYMYTIEAKRLNLQEGLGDWKTRPLEYKGDVPNGQQQQQHVRHHEQQQSDGRRSESPIGRPPTSSSVGPSPSSTNDANIQRSDAFRHASYAMAG
jgi:hypothetical protein